MKLLLDAMMPEELGVLLVGHEVSHVGDLGWRHLSNGNLLNSGEGGGYEAVITKDANMPYQQNMVGRNIGLVIVRTQTQDMEDLLGLTPEILRALSELTPGSVVRVVQARQADHRPTS